MPAIYTDEWFANLQTVVNKDEKVTSRAPQGEWRLIIQTDGDGVSPYFKEGESLRFFVTLKDGKCESYTKILDGEEEPDELDFRVRGPATVFERIAAEIDEPMKIALKWSIKITGDMRLLLLHADIVKRVLEIYSKEMDTEWPKGTPPYN